MYSGRSERLSGDGGGKLLWHFTIEPISSRSEGLTSEISLYLNCMYVDLEIFSICLLTVIRV